MYEHLTTVFFRRLIVRCIDMLSINKSSMVDFSDKKKMIAFGKKILNLGDLLCYIVHNKHFFRVLLQKHQKQIVLENSKGYTNFAYK